MAENTQKKEKKIDSSAVAHIKSTFNNTHVTISDRFGNVLVWQKAGSSGFKGSRKSTAYAATLTAQKAAEVAMSLGLISVSCRSKRSWSRKGISYSCIISFGFANNFY